jgi:hypothetical protein
MVGSICKDSYQVYQEITDQGQAEDLQGKQGPALKESAFLAIGNDGPP